MKYFFKNSFGFIALFIVGLFFSAGFDVVSAESDGDISRHPLYFSASTSVEVYVDPIVDALPNRLYTSNVLIMTGRSGPFAITATTGFIIKNGVNVGSRITGFNGDRISFAMTSSSLPSTEERMYINFSFFERQFSITTKNVSSTSSSGVGTLPINSSSQQQLFAQIDEKIMQQSKNLRVKYVMNVVSLMRSIDVAISKTNNQNDKMMLNNFKNYLNDKLNNDTYLAHIRKALEEPKTQGWFCYQSVMNALSITQANYQAPNGKIFRIWSNGRQFISPDIINPHINCFDNLQTLRGYINVRNSLAGSKSSGVRSMQQEGYGFTQPSSSTTAKSSVNSKSNTSTSNVPNDIMNSLMKLLE